MLNETTHLTPFFIILREVIYMNVYWFKTTAWLHSFLGAAYKDVIASVLSIIILLAIYSFISFFIKKQNRSPEKKYRTLVTVRNSFLIIFLLIQVFVWSGEIKTLFLSAAAIMAAMIITFKELIMCFVGSFWVGSNKLFSIGDYIEYDNVRGKVMDRNLLYTKVLLGTSFQAKELNIPNAFFVTNRVINLSRFGKYQCYDLVLPIDNISQLNSYQTYFGGILQEILTPYQERYLNYFNEKKMHDMFFEIPTQYHNIVYDLTDGAKIKLKISFLVHPADYEEVEQKILQYYITEASRLYEEKKKELLQLRYPEGVA